MKKLLSALLLPFFLCLAPACGNLGPVETEEEKEEVGVADSALVSENALVPNALVPNALVPNALVPNALVPNALVPNALSPTALTALQADGAAGEVSRQLLLYVVGCAFSPTQSFSFSWTDGSGAVHAEQYWGVLGIAPGWATSPLTDETRQRLVSGCLAARVNWYGVSVVISIRSHKEPLRTRPSSPEITSFPRVEGAFWGNLFGPTPYLHACHDADNVAVARAASRDCAAGHVNEDGDVVPCGIITLTGPCSLACHPLSAGMQHYAACIDRPGEAGSAVTKAVVTTALP